MNNQLSKLLLTLGIATASAFTSINPVLASVPTQDEKAFITEANSLTTTIIAKASVPVKYDLIQSSEAIKGAVPIVLYLGKIVSIDFTDVDEYITFLAPSDKSQFALTTDLPAESGEAQTVYLLPIKKLNFQGSYTTSHPNIIIKTINSQGQSKQYNFIVNFSSGVMTSTGIKIVPPLAQKSPFDNQKIRVSASQQVDADAVERGLKIAIAKQFVKSNDPVVNNVRNFIFMLRNGNTVNESIVATGVNPSVVESLGEMYLEVKVPLKLRQNLVVSNLKGNSDQQSETTPPYNDGVPSSPKLSGINGIEIISDYLKPLAQEIEQEPESELKQKLKLALAELEAGNNPSQITEKYDLSSKWFYKMMKAYLVSNRK